MNTAWVNRRRSRRICRDLAATRGPRSAAVQPRRAGPRLPKPRLLELGDLAEVELDGRLTPEDVDQHLDLQLVFVDLDDLAAEVRERAFLDADGLADLPLEAGLGAGAHGGRLLALHRSGEEGLDLTATQGRGLGALADEAGDAGGVADHVPGVVIEEAAHQQVAGEHLLLDDDLLAVLELGHLLHGDDHFVDAALHVHGRRAG